MSNELEFLARRVAAGKVSRRDFLGRAAALGMSAALANSLVGGAVRAAGSVKGGVLKAGLQGGESTDNLDPAAIKNQVTGAFARSWGEKLIDVDATGNIIHQLAEDHGSSADAKTWTFKIRKDVTFHNGKTLTASDVLATIERHAGPETKSGCLIASG
jgi:peptide/nickel transport system substrate-binding protein